MNCKFCGAELPLVERGNSGHRPREYCNDAHKQAYYRRQHQQDQDAALLAEAAELRAKVADQAQTIADLERELEQLRSRLDVERRYLSDIKPHHFKSWLKKQPASPFVSKMFADPLFPARGPRSLYEAHVRRMNASPEEHDDFVRLWKLMLLQS